MRFDVVTLFPELFAPHLKTGVTRRAFETGQVQVSLWPLRDFASDAYRRVDDRPFGGGPGMVMLAEPLEAALAAVRAERGSEDSPHCVVHFTPAGQRLDQAQVKQFAAGGGAILLCGRYEGIDQRVLDRHVTHQISLGDYVISGGELAALVLLDAVARLQPGVLSTPSHEQDSFSDGLLEGPAYSRPERLHRTARTDAAVAGQGAGSGSDAGSDGVPEVLLSGHHARIARWRREQSLALTARRRPDLIEAARVAGRLSAEDERYLASAGL